MVDKVDVKVIDVVTDDMCIEDFNFCECMNCHWRFIGDAQRYGYGYTSEGTDLVNFCPMCGKKIGKIVD